MIYSILATIVALSHGVGLIVLFLGTVLVFLNRLRKWLVLEKIYLSFAVFMVISFIITRGCYLTDIEVMLWKKANSPNLYTGGYISHYLAKVGIIVEDIVVYWFLVGILILGLGTYLLRIFKNILEKKNFGKER